MSRDFGEIPAEQLSLHVQILKIKKTFTAPFYERGSTASRLQSHYKEAVYFFTTKFPEISATHFIDLGRMKA